PGTSARAASPSRRTSRAASPTARTSSSRSRPAAGRRPPSPWRSPRLSAESLPPRTHSSLVQVVVKDLDDRVVLALLGGEHPQPAAALLQETDQVFEGIDLDEPLILAGPGRGFRPADRPLAGRLPGHGPRGRPAHQEPPAITPRPLPADTRLPGV